MTVITIGFAIGTSCAGWIGSADTVDNDWLTRTFPPDRHIRIGLLAELHVGRYAI